VTVPPSRDPPKLNSPPAPLPPVTLPPHSQPPQPLPPVTHNPPPDDNKTCLYNMGTLFAYWLNGKRHEASPSNPGPCPPHKDAAHADVLPIAPLPPALASTPHVTVLPPATLPPVTVDPHMPMTHYPQTGLHSNPGTTRTNPSPATAHLDPHPPMTHIYRAPHVDRWSLQGHHRVPQMHVNRVMPRMSFGRHRR
jgi:hypothetical protein